MSSYVIFVLLSCIDTMYVLCQMKKKIENYKKKILENELTESYQSFYVHQH